MFCQNPTSTAASSRFGRCGPVEVGPVVCAKMLRHFETYEFSDLKAFFQSRSGSGHRYRMLFLCGLLVPSTEPLDGKSL